METKRIKEGNHTFVLGTSLSLRYDDFVLRLFLMEVSGVQEQRNEIGSMKTIKMQLWLEEPKVCLEESLIEIR